MSIVPSFNQIVANHNNYLANRSRRGIWFDPVVAAGKVARGAYGIYKKEAERKKLSGTPHFRGYQKTRVSPSALSSVSKMSGYAATSGSRWRKTFKSRGLSKRRRNRYKRRFIGCRNKRQYLSKWTIANPPGIGSTAGQIYRYAVYDIAPKDILQTMVVADSATAAGGTTIFDRGQKVFMSKWRKDVYIKNPFSIGINYRVIWTYTEITDSTTNLSAIEPWCPVFHRDEWKNRDEKFIRQDVGYLSADEDVTLHGRGFGQFVKMTAVDSRKLTYRMHIWLWSELQVQKGTDYSTAPTLGYLNINVPVVYRDAFNFMLDQGLTVNDNIQSGYVSALTTITAPLVKTEDKMVADR